MIEGPMVPMPEVAKAIYLAVAQGRGDRISPAKSIEVIDDGDRWPVLQLGGGRQP